MLSAKNIFPKLIILLISILSLNSLAGNDIRINGIETTPNSKIKKSDFFETKGIIEPVIEFVNGNNFQQNTFYSKKIFSHNAKGVLELSRVKYSYFLKRSYSNFKNSAPLYITFRSIRI